MANCLRPTDQLLYYWLCFFLACGETNFSNNVKNIPNIMSWILNVLCCRGWSKLLLIFFMCGSFQACTICKKFWKIIKAFVYYSFAVMSLFKIYFFPARDDFGKWRERANVNQSFEHAAWDFSRKGILW